MIADPYPADLAALDVEPINPSREAVANRLIATLNRLAQALEQNTLALLDRPGVPTAPVLAALPPVQPAAANGTCPIHNTPWRVVPAGISKKTGNAYEAFRACSTTGCDQRPPR